VASQGGITMVDKFTLRDSATKISLDATALSMPVVGQRLHMSASSSFINTLCNALMTGWRLGLAGRLPESLVPVIKPHRTKPVYLLVPKARPAHAALALLSLTA
jgi:hypothetical protein